MCQVGTALASKCVDTIATDRACREFAQDVFKYDDRIIANPGPEVCTAPRRPCALLNWGLCSKDSATTPCSDAAYNLYARLQGFRLSRKCFPLVACFKSAASEMFVVVTDTIGKGETVLLCELEAPVATVCRLAHMFVSGKRRPIACTAQMCFSKMLGKLKATSLGDVDFTGLAFQGRIFNHKPVDVENEVGFQLQIPSVADFTMPFVGRLKMGKHAVKEIEPAKLPMGLKHFSPSVAAGAAGKKCNNSDLVGEPDESAQSSHHSADKAAAGMEGDCDADSDPDSEIHDPEGAGDENPDEVPSGMRLGIVGFDVTPTNAAKCWCCKAPLGKGNLRLWWRAKAKMLEKSMHVKCAEDMSFSAADVTPAHIRMSIQFLTASIVSEETAATAAQLKAVVDAFRTVS